MKFKNFDEYYSNLFKSLVQINEGMSQNPVDLANFPTIQTLYNTTESEDIDLAVELLQQNFFDQFFQCVHNAISFAYDESRSRNDYMNYVGDLLGKLRKIGKKCVSETNNYVSSGKVGSDGGSTIVNLVNEAVSECIRFFDSSSPSWKMMDSAVIDRLEKWNRANARNRNYVRKFKFIDNYSSDSGYMASSGSVAIEGGDSPEGGEPKTDSPSDEKEEFRREWIAANNPEYDPANPSLASDISDEEVQSAMSYVMARASGKKSNDVGIGELLEKISGKYVKVV